MEGAFTFEKGDPFKLVDLESTEEVYLVPLGANVNVNANANANATKFTVSTTPDSPPSQTTYQTLLDTLDERGPCMPSNFRCISASSPPSSSSSVKFLCSWLSLGSLGAGWDLSHIPPSDLTTATGALAKHLDGEHVEGNHLLDLFRALTTSQSREGEDSVDDMIRLASLENKNENENENNENAYDPEAAYDLVETLCHLRTSLCAYLSWSIPTPLALRSLLSHCPLIEVGAGTGYWSHLLREKMGGDVVSYELEGSQEGQGFRFRHVDVKGVKDGIEAVKEEGNAGRTLFLAWPDPVGGDAVGDGDRDEFGVRCLEAYEGERVCYVGELGPGVCRTRVEEDDDGVGGEEEEEEEEEVVVVVVVVAIMMVREALSAALLRAQATIARLKFGNSYSFETSAHIFFMSLFPLVLSRTHTHTHTHIYTHKRTYDFSLYPR